MPMSHAVFITRGPADWQIIQQDAGGRGRIEVAGTWAVPADRKAPQVFVRLVRTDDASPVTARLDWSAAATEADGTWNAVLAGIPAGGLYRLETQIRTASHEPNPEWAIRGEARDFLGVGDLWIMAGQSNSAGYGKGPCDDPPELGIHLFANAWRWRLASHPLHDVTGVQQAINLEWANPGHAPWLAFAKRLRRSLGHPIGLIATALGGSPLKRWNPGEHSDPSAADLFTNCQAAVAAAGGAVRGMVWYQGCSDTGDGLAAETYLDRFCSAVSHWRRVFGQDLPIITVQLDRVTTVQTPAAHRGWSLVREAQRLAPHRLKQVAVVPAHDLPLSDLVHVSPAGNLVLGARVAEAALGMVYGRDTAWRVPEVESAIRSADGSSVTLHVTQVTGCLRAADSSAQPFLVEDQDGMVPITATEYPSPSIVLRLGRPLLGEAFISAAIGAHPPLLPVDMTRNLPLLAFHRLPITRALPAPQGGL